MVSSAFNCRLAMLGSRLWVGVCCPSIWVSFWPSWMGSSYRGLFSRSITERQVQPCEHISASVHFTFTNVPLITANHMAEPQVNTQGSILHPRGGHARIYNYVTGNRKIATNNSIYYCVICSSFFCNDCGSFGIKLVITFQRDNPNNPESHHEPERWFCYATFCQCSHASAVCPLILLHQKIILYLCRAQCIMFQIVLLTHFFVEVSSQTIHMHLLWPQLISQCPRNKGKHGILLKQFPILADEGHPSGNSD